LTKTTDIFQNQPLCNQEKESQADQLNAGVPSHRSPAGLTTRPGIIFTYTNLNCYSSICPHQFWHRYILKTVPYKPTEAMQWGNDVHDAFQKRIQGGKPLPDTMRQWETLAAPFAERGAQTEVQLAVGYTYQETDYWGKGTQVPFVRGKIDCAVVNNTRAYMADWKTGKRREDPFELEIGAMLLKARYPDLQIIIGTYVWLQDSDLGKPHDLSDTNKTFRKCQQIAQEISQDQVFEKRPGPLCGWCGVKTCEYNRNAA